MILPLLGIAAIAAISIGVLVAFAIRRGIEDRRLAKNQLDF